MTTTRRTTLTLCAALVASACGKSAEENDATPSPTESEDATETNVRMVQPAEASNGTPPQAFPGEACDGCARFFLPMTGENQRADFELALAEPIDMTGATVTFRLMASGFTGNAGGVSVYVRDAARFDKGFVWTNLTALAAWTDVRIDFTDASLAGNPSFDITRVAQVGVQLNSAGAFAGARWQDATVYLDAVHFSSAPTADLSFTEALGPFTLVTPDAPAGASVGFIAP